MTSDRLDDRVGFRRTKRSSRRSRRVSPDDGPRLRRGPREAGGDNGRACGGALGRREKIDRLAATMAACALLWLAPSAVAQERASGGGSFNDAPMLQTGTYSDTIRSGETLFWGVELLEGERVQARVRVTSPGDHPPAEVRLVLFNSLRREDELSTDGELIRDRGRALLGTSSTPVTPTNTDYPEPGLHYVSLAVQGLQEPRQFDVTLSIDVALGEALAVDGQEIVAPAPRSEEPDPGPSRVGTYAWLFAAGVAVGGVALLVRDLLFGAGRRLRQGL